MGGGFTGLFTALNLSQSKYTKSVTLIDRNDRFSFNPMMYEYPSGEMSDEQVYPRYLDLLEGSGVRFVQDSVASIDLRSKCVQSASDLNYTYDNLVLALGSVGSYFGIKGAKEHTFLFRTGEQAIALGKHRQRLQKATQTQDEGQRRQLLTVAIVGAGASGVELAATLADLLPIWYANVSLRGTLLKLGLGESVANLFDRYQVKGKLGHAIRETTYLTLLPTPVHNFKATTGWLIDEIFEQNNNAA